MVDVAAGAGTKADSCSVDRKQVEGVVADRTLVGGVVVVCQMPVEEVAVVRHRVVVAFLSNQQLH